MTHRFLSASTLLFASLILPLFCEAEPVVIEQLFEYITPPDTMQNLSSRSDYLIKNFWSPMDLKSKKPVDQNALNHAFGVYALAMQWADAKTVTSSTNDLLKKLSKNPPLLLQFTKAAEETLYGPRASMWIDQIYIIYLQALEKDKKLDPLRKLRYMDQLKRLKATQPGEKAPSFSFLDTEKKLQTYKPMSTFTIIEFGDPTCMDCILAKHRLDTNPQIMKYLDEGRLNILFIMPDVDEDDFEWIEQLQKYPRQWNVGAAHDVAEIYDLRLTPTIYVIDASGKIVAKNITVDQAINFTTEVLK